MTSTPNTHRAPVHLSPDVRVLYPFAAHYFPVAEGLRLHYVDEGEGKPLLMVHGNPTWSFYYRDLVKALSPDYRCVVPDHIGCGLSDKPQDWSYTIADHTRNLVRLVEGLDLRDVTLLVHDWGGPIAYAAALRLPGRFKRFVVFNSAVFFLPLPMALIMLRIPVFGSVLVRGVNAFQRVGFRLAVGHRERFRGAVAAGYMAPYDSWANRIAILRFIQEIPIEPNHPNRRLLEELEAGLPSLAALPHLVVWGKKDWVFHSGYLEGWKQRVPTAEVHELDDVSHWVVEEASERVLPLVRNFLAKHPVG